MAIEGLTTPHADSFGAIKKHSGDLQDAIRANRKAQTAKPPEETEIIKVDAENADVQPRSDGRGTQLDVLV